MAPLLDCQYVEDNDLVASYLADALPEEAAKVFEQHYLGCDRCSGELQAGLEVRSAFGTPAASRNLNAPTPTKPAFRWTDRRFLAVAASVGLMALVTGLFLRSPSSRNASSTSLAALVEAAGGAREFEPRLANLPYAPRRPATRGSGSVSDEGPEALRLKSIAYQVIHDTTRNAAPEAARAAALAHMLLKDWDQAISRLREGLRSHPSDAYLHNDLAAAYYVRGRHGISDDSRNEDLGHARAEAEEALRLQPDFQAAVFNRALILQALNLRQEAEEAWSGYLTIDSTSGWADEARAHRREMRGGP